MRLYNDPEYLDALKDNEKDMSLASIEDDHSLQSIEMEHVAKEVDIEINHAKDVEDKAQNSKKMSKIAHRKAKDKELIRGPGLELEMNDKKQPIGLELPVEDNEKVLLKSKSKSKSKKSAKK